MAFDFKKEYKEIYLLKNKPSIIKISRINYLTVRGPFLTKLMFTSINFKIISV